MTVTAGLVSALVLAGPLTGTIFAHGSRDVAQVALTFDACSSGGANRLDEPLLRALEAADVPATIFLGGIWMERQPGAVRRLAANPRFELGLHGWDHRHLAKLSDALLRSHFEKSRGVFRALAGRDSVLFRPPFGIALVRDARLAAEAGLVTVTYDLASGDPDPAFTKEVLTRYVVKRARNGSVIIFHLNGRGHATAVALPGIVAGLRTRGFAFTTVGAMLVGR
ncbi:MAG: polysaccharide deacetylase family protein [Candidatus Coatesbacteria bacterium]